jgi:hypothetical protein
VVDNVRGGELGANSDRSSEAQRTHHPSSTSANDLARALPDAICSKPQRRCGADDPGDCIGEGKDRFDLGHMGVTTSRQFFGRTGHTPDGCMLRIWRSATSSASPGLRGKVRLLQATCRSGRTRTAPESSVPEKLVHAR